jgi:hypothetical protein
VDRSVVDRVELDAADLTAVGESETIDDQRAAMWDGEPLTDARRAEVLAPLEGLEERRLGLRVEAQERHQLLE